MWSQFMQRVYQWGPDWQSYIDSIEMIVQTLGTLFAVPILVRLMKLADVQLSLVGFIILFTTYMIKGLWLNPMGEYLYENKYWLKTIPNHLKREIDIS